MGQALNMATPVEIDAVIDPAETRAWLVRRLASSRVSLFTNHPIDTW